MTVSETIERVLKPIQQFTRGWMMAPSTVERGREIGLQTGNLRHGDGPADQRSALVLLVRAGLRQMVRDCVS